MIDKQQFERYEKALHVNADLVKAAVIALEGELNTLSGDALNRQLLASYMALVDEYGRYAAAVALEFYEQQRQEAGLLDDYEAQMFAPNNARLLAWEVAEKRKQAADAAGALNLLGNSAIQRVNAYADETIIRNAQTDPASPKWALVPHAGACAWCRMIGGLGFQYSKEYGKGEGMRHDSCKCTMVVDFDTKHPSLDGYNDLAYAKAYNQAQKEVLGDNPYDVWDVMSSEEKGQYKSYDHWRRNVTLAYMNRH